MICNTFVQKIHQKNKIKNKKIEIKKKDPERRRKMNMHILFYEAPRILSLLVHNDTIHINNNCDIFNLQYYCICLCFELIREERNVVESEQFVECFYLHQLYWCDDLDGPRPALTLGQKLLIKFIENRKPILINTQILSPYVFDE